MTYYDRRPTTTRPNDEDTEALAQLYRLIKGDYTPDYNNIQTSRLKGGSSFNYNSVDLQTIERIRQVNPEAAQELIDKNEKERDSELAEMARLIHGY